MHRKSILLIEPGYKNKYPPIGLMKIATYHGEYGKKDYVKFIKGEDDKSVLDTVWDRIYVTSLFSFEWKKLSKSIDFALEAAGGQASKVFAGGIAVSLMHQAFVDETKWRGIRFIKGLLKDSPAKSLQLDEFEEELYSDDHGPNIEDLIPDYSILNQIEYTYPVEDAYFAYASRGCTRKCSFCGVPKLEGDLYKTPSLTKVVNGIKERYGEKRDLILMDNNIVASPAFKDVIAEIRELGFIPGATLKSKKGRICKRRVDFNQGVDARILCKGESFMDELSSICISPLRIAFDHVGLKKQYVKSVRYAAKHKLWNLSNYMLYNFHDSPSDLYERMRINIELNIELGTNIFSFPMRYQPTDRKDRGHVGEKWTKYQLRSFQIILQATHGVVSGKTEFFKVAFGASASAFEELLLRPHQYIFHRQWYERLKGNEEYSKFKSQFDKLSDVDLLQLKDLIKDFGSKKFSVFNEILKNKMSKRVASIIEYYRPLSKEDSNRIFIEQKTCKEAFKEQSPNLDNVERVEDAGLEIDPILLELKNKELESKS